MEKHLLFSAAAGLNTPRFGATTMTEKGFTVIDADGLIMGRMASIVAKRLLNGERITVVNAEKVIISGNRASIVRAQKKFLEVGGTLRGPIHWRKPDRMLRKTIRGMLPTEKPKGKEAFKLLKVYIGVPSELSTTEKETLREIQSSRLRGRFVTLGEVAKTIGWNP